MPKNAIAGTRSTSLTTERARRTTGADAENVGITQVEAVPAISKKVISSK